MVRTLIKLRQFDIFADIIDYNLRSGKSEKSVFKTGYGFQIDKLCFDVFGKNKFLEILKNAIIEGAACLQKLNTTQSLEHLHKLSDLLKGQLGAPQIDCSSGGDETFSWEDSTLAKGHVGKGEIWLRVDYKEKVFDRATTPAVAERKLSSTIFHEMLHNIGYSHDEGVEYVYTCERCCNPLPSDSDGSINAACNICKTSYTPNNKIEYLRELSQASALSSRISYEASIDEFLQESDFSDDTLMFLYEESSTDFLKAVGRARAIKKLLASRSKALSPKAKETENLQYLNYSKFINEDSTHALEGVANMHDISFQVLSLKSFYLNLDSSSIETRVERREIAKKILEVYEQIDFSRLDLRGKHELDNRVSLQSALESLILVYENLNKRGALVKDMGNTKAANQLVEKYLELKRESLSNIKKIESLSL